MAADVSAFSYFMPVFAFLLVFIVVYAVLKATQVLGSSEASLIFVSLILAAFFVVEASLVDVVVVSGAWIAVGILVVFFVLMILGFVPGADLKKFFGSGESNWFAWILLVGVLVAFIVSAAYAFNWVVDWGEVEGWFNTEWFGFILLLVVAGVVSWKIK